MRTPVPHQNRAAPTVHPTVERLAAYSWRLLAIAAVVVAALWLFGRLLIIVLPLIVALLLSRVLSGPARWLVDRRWPPFAATWAVIIAFMAILALAALQTPDIVDEFANLGPSVSQAIDRVEEWFLHERPFGFDAADIETFRDDMGGFIAQTLTASAGTLVTGARLLVETVAGLILSLVLAFFLVKDGRAIKEWALSHTAPDRRPRIEMMAEAAWSTLGSFLIGATILGIIEALAIGVTLQLVGASLVVPLMLLTFLGAFIPFLGALVSGIIATLVAFATADLRAAVIVAIVAVLVQQFDGDLLAPAIYGRALKMHPLVVLVAVTSGTALFGLVGAFLSVPATAVAISVVTETRSLEVPGPSPSAAAAVGVPDD